MINGEAEFPAHGKHFPVLAEDHAFDPRYAIGTGVIDDLAQQFPAEAIALQICPDEQGIFGNGVVRIA